MIITGNYDDNHDHGEHDDHDDDVEDEKRAGLCGAFKASGMQDLYSASHQLHNTSQDNCYSHEEHYGFYLNQGNQV